MKLGQLIVVGLMIILLVAGIAALAGDSATAAADQAGLGAGTRVLKFRRRKSGA